MEQTYGELMESALRCETKEQAEEWIEVQIRYYVECHGHTVESAFSLIKHNLGYMAGYYDKQTADKIKALFDADHPGYAAFKGRML